MRNRCLLLLGSNNGRGQQEQGKCESRKKAPSLIQVSRANGKLRAEQAHRKASHLHPYPEHKVAAASPSLVQPEVYGLRVSE